MYVCMYVCIDEIAFYLFGTLLALLLYYLGSFESKTNLTHNNLSHCQGT